MAENIPNKDPDPGLEAMEDDGIRGVDSLHSNKRPKQSESLSDESFSPEYKKGVTIEVQEDDPQADSLFESPLKNEKITELESSPKPLVIAEKTPKNVLKESNQYTNDPKKTSSLNSKEKNKNMILLCVENTDESKTNLNIAKISLSTIANRLFDVIDPKDIGDKRLNKKKQWATVEIKDTESLREKTKKFLKKINDNAENGSQTLITASMAVSWRVRVLQRSAIGVVRGVPEDEDIDELAAYCRAENNGIISVRKVGRNTISLKFEGSLPDSVSLPLRGWTNKYDVEPYITGPRQCLNCYQFHPKGLACPNASACIVCGEEGHKGRNCIIEDPICPLCGGGHGPRDRECPVVIKNNEERTKLIQESRSNLPKPEPTKNVWVNRQNTEIAEQTEEIKENLGNAMEINIKQLEEKITKNIESFFKTKMAELEQTWSEKIDKRLDKIEKMLTASNAHNSPNHSVTTEESPPNHFNEKIMESITAGIQVAMESAFANFNFNLRPSSPETPVDQ